MQRRSWLCQSITGAAIPACSITVYTAGTLTKATIYGDQAGSSALGNPITAGSDGTYTYYAANGRYTEVLTASGFTFGAAQTQDFILNDPLAAPPASAVQTNYTLVFNVLSFGAVADNVTDNTTAFQNAINACGTAGGGIVYFPNSPTAPNTYRFSGPLTLTTQSRCQLRGAGAGQQDDYVTGGAVTFLAHTGSAEAIKIGGTQALAELVLQDFALQCNANSTYGIRFINTTNTFAARSRVERVQVLNCNKTGAVGVSVEGGVELTFTHVYAYNNYDGFFVTGSQATVLTFRGVLSRNNTRYGFFVQNISSATTQIVLDDGYVFESNGSSGVFINPTTTHMYTMVFHGGWIGANNATTAGSQFQVTGGGGFTLRNLRMDGVQFATGGASVTGDIDFDSVVGAVLTGLAGGSPGGKNCLKIESTSSDIHYIGFNNSSGCAVDPDNRAALAVPFQSGVLQVLNGIKGAAAAPLILDPSSAGVVIGNTTTTRQFEVYGTDVIQKTRRAANSNFGLWELVTGSTQDWLIGERNSSDSDFHLFSSGTSVDEARIWRAGGITVGNPTGNNKGTGTLNASSYYVHGTAIASMPLTNASGTVTNAPHIVQDTVTLIAGSAGVALAGAAAFTNATSYTCICDDDTAIAACRVVQNGGNGFTISGTGTDVVRFICVGN